MLSQRSLLYYFHRFSLASRSSAKQSFNHQGAQKMIIWILNITLTCSLGRVWNLSPAKGYLLQSLSLDIQRHLRKKELNYINVTTIAALQGHMAHTNPVYPSSGSNQSNLLSNMTYYCLKWPGIVQLVKEKNQIHFVLPHSDRYIQWGGLGWGRCLFHIHVP